MTIHFLSHKGTETHQQAAWHSLTYSDINFFLGSFFSCLATRFKVELISFSEVHNVSLCLFFCTL